MSVSVEAPKPAPIAARVARLRQALVESLTEDDVRAVTRKLVELASDGDLRAARLLLSYALGKPGDALPPAAPETPRIEARPAPAAAAVPPMHGPALDDLTLSDLITHQIQRERSAADTKRGKRDERRPISVPTGHPCARTEAISLVNLPDSKRP